MRFFLLLVCLLSSLLRPLFSQDGLVNEAFEELCKGLFEASEPGGSILVMKGEEVKFLGNYGLANIESGEQITENTVFNTGSISKTFVSNAILILHERGKLSVKDPISKYFPDFSDSSIADSVRIEHLLSHTSGLPDIRNIRGKSAFFISAKDKGNWDPIKKTRELEFIPGSKFKYSNPAFNGLALIIEQVTGEKWQSFVEREIFLSAGMERSTITDGSHPASEVAHGYIMEGGSFVESDYGEVPTFAAAGNGGVWSSVVELAKYEKAMRSYRFLSKEVLDESRQVYMPSEWEGRNEPTVGYSWFLNTNSRFGVDADEVKVVFHTGSQGGFRSFFISIPEKDIVYIALFNRPFTGYSAVIEEGLRILKNANWLEE